MSKGSGTRSGLLWEVERLLHECAELPQVLLMENVPQVVGSGAIADFAQWLDVLQRLGYKNYHRLMNAKDYGIPQNRNRCFMVSILGDYYYTFPKPQKLQFRLKDYLDRNVDEKYYLSDATIEMFMEHTAKQREKGNGFKFEPTNGGGYAKTISTRAGGRTDDNFIIEQGNEARTNNDGRVGHGVAQTLTTGDAQQVVVEPTSDYRFYQPAIETLQENDCEAGDTIDAYNKRVNKDGLSPAITTRPDGFKTAILPVVADEEPDAVWNNNLGCFVDAKTGEMLVGDHTDAPPPKPNCRIRKLTPRECFRLMGVKQDDYERAAKHQSVSSQYHLAGDSIVTTCLMAIFGELLSIDYNTKISEITEELRDAD